jgi:hypothetical protein
MTPAGQKAINRDRARSGRHGETGRSAGTAPTSAQNFRTVSALARVEALRLGRSVLVLAGLLAGGIVAWDFIHQGEPLWWNAAWEIGYGQVVLSMTVLAAAQLATGRVQRDGMQDVYGSLPVSAATRIAAHLIAVVGGVPASLVLVGTAAGFLEGRGDVIGDPNAAVLISGILLVLAAGAIGVAIGRRFPHPLAGLLGAIVWFVPISQSNRFSGTVTWLFPWVIPDQLKWLPAPLAGYPPAVGHAGELVGIAVLAAVVAIAPAAKVVRPRKLLMAVAALAVALICVAGVVQLQPIPTADLNHLVDAVGDPASAQQCTPTNGVRYCLYPGFDTILPSLQSPVDGVLALLPARPPDALTVSQAATLSLGDTALTHGHSRQQLTAWNAQLRGSPANAASASTIYVTVGAWPAGGSQTDARFDVALAAAEWSVGLPTSTASQRPPCVPIDQAREAVAIWLAVIATHTSPGQLGTPGRARHEGRYTLLQVGNTPIVGWSYPGENAPYLASSGPQLTDAGYLLAEAMTRLPAEKVTQELDTGWAGWTNWHTTDAQLAGALGIPTPTVPAPDISPRPGHTIGLPPAGRIRSQPVCTA